MIQIWTQCAGDHLITCVIIHFHYCHHHHDQRHDHHHDSQHQQHDQRLSSIEETWSSTSLQPRPRPRRKVLKLFNISWLVSLLLSLLSLFCDKMGSVCCLPFHCCLSSKPTVPHGWWTILMIIVIIMTLKYIYWAATNSDPPPLDIFSNPYNFDWWHIVFRWSHVGSQWDGQVLLKIGTSKRTFRGFCVLVRTITHFVLEFLMLLSMSRY